MAFIKPIVEPVRIPVNAPFRNARVTSDVAYAIRGLNAGEATPFQQKLALDWVINEVSRFYDLSFRDNQKHQDFAEGKRYVAQQIIRVLNMDGQKIAEMKAREDKDVPPDDGEMPTPEGSPP